MNITREEYRALAGTPKRKGKYGAIKTVVDGITFDSRAEAKRYGELKSLERGGDIIMLGCHPKFDGCRAGNR